MTHVLPMNLAEDFLLLLLLSIEERRVRVRLRVRVRQTRGSCSRCSAARPRGPSMNLPGHRIAACRGKAALKTHALQTLTRRPLTPPRARSVWSAPDLSALSVRRGTASSSWSQCTVAGPKRLSRNLPRARYCKLRRLEQLNSVSTAPGN